MVLVSREMEPASCLDFRAEVYVLYHSSRICLGFQTVIHVGNVMQTATIVEMSKVGAGRGHWVSLVKRC